MGKHYDQFLESAIGRLPEHFAERRQMIAIANDYGDMAIRLDEKDAEAAARACARSVVQEDLSAALEVVGEKPELLRATVDVGQYPTLGWVIVEAVSDRIANDMADNARELYLSQYGGMGLPELIAESREAIEAAGRLKARREGFDTSRFEARVAELEGNSHPYALQRFVAAFEEMSNELVVRGEVEVGRRLWEAGLFAAYNQDMFRPEAAARP